MSWSSRARLIALVAAGIVLIGAAAAIQPVRTYLERRYLDAALSIIEVNSVQRSVEWTAIRRRAHDRLTASASRSDTYEIIRAALRESGDRHSGVIEPAMATRLASVTASDNPQPSGERLSERIGYLRVPGFSGTSESAATEGASRLEEIVHRLDDGPLCGWVVDLRTNTGGNMWPMLAGLGPLLGEGELGASVSANGRRLVWTYDSGAAKESGRVRARVSGPGYRLRREPSAVAVLLGPQTASSGEAVAIAFRGRPHTLMFGQPTRGFTTSNSPFRLSDGALLNLSVATFADRDGHRYPDGVIPDRPTSPDDTHAQAIDWVLRGPCASPNGPV